MVNKIFLRSKKFLRSNCAGLSLTELLIAVTILMILFVMVLYGFKPSTQLSKARDSRKKADLVKIKNLLEDYYNDHNCYPEQLQNLVLEDYIDRIPSSLSESDYEYVSDCQSYRVYAILEYEEDSDIAEVGCSEGCGPGGGTPGGNCDYNFGVSSTNVGLESCGGTDTGCIGSWWSCNGGSVCQNVQGSGLSCNPKFCNDSNCQGACLGGADFCH